MDLETLEKSITGAVKGVGDRVQVMETEQEKLVKNLDQLSTETKSAMAELTTAKNRLDSAEDVLKSIAKLQKNLRMEQRLAFADPVARIIADEEKRTRFNCFVRAAVDKNGDMLKRIAPQLKALGEDSSPGSTMIDDALAADIYDLLARYGSWSTLGVRNMGTKQTKFPIKTARPVANFILTEGGTISDDSNKAGTSVTLEVEVIACLLEVSMQLLEDSEFDVTADVLDDFREAYNYRADWAAFMANGDSDATDGAMTGLFEAGTAATAASGNTTMENLDFEDVIRCLTTVDSAVLSRGARWWMHPQMLVRMLHVKDGNGRPIFLTANEAPSAGAIGSILGYPVTLIEVGPNTNSAGNAVAAFGDPQSHVVGVRRDFMFEASDHHKWNTYERAFRGIGRFGVKNRKATGSAILTLATA